MKKVVLIFLLLNVFGYLLSLESVLMLESGIFNMLFKYFMMKELKLYFMVVFICFSVLMLMIDGVNFEIVIMDVSFVVKFEVIMSIMNNYVFNINFVKLFFIFFFVFIYKNLFFKMSSEKMLKWLLNMILKFLLWVKKMMVMVNYIIFEIFDNFLFFGFLMI